MAQVLYDLQQVLSESDFDTIKAFIVLYNKVQPDKAGQTYIAFQFFVENLETRYNRKFWHCQDVLQVNLDNFGLQVIEQDLHRPHTSLLDTPEFTMGDARNKADSEECRIRKNMGKIYTHAIDESNHKDIDSAAKMEHTQGLVEAIEKETAAQIESARQTEMFRYAKYAEGKVSSSPQRK